jgi:hypothetical protein
MDDKIMTPQGKIDSLKAKDWIYLHSIDPLYVNSFLGRFKNIGEKSGLPWENKKAIFLEPHMAFRKDEKTGLYFHHRPSKQFDNYMPVIHVLGDSVLLYIGKKEILEGMQENNIEYQSELVKKIMNSKHL